MPVLGPHLRRALSLCCVATLSDQENGAAWKERGGTGGCRNLRAAQLVWKPHMGFIPGTGQVVPAHFLPSPELPSPSSQGLPNLGCPATLGTWPATDCQFLERPQEQTRQRSDQPL